MPIQINPATKQPYKILIFGDLVVPSGFGRICNEVGKRLKQRGYQVQGAGISYSGWPHNTGLDWVWPLAGQDIWGALVNIVNSTQPDLLISCQDFPYHVNIWNACRIDFSKVRWVWITPIDGTPVHPDWVKLCDHGDGMVISRFGVEALRQAGKRVDLCHPGVDVGEFWPAEPDERAELRKKAGIPADAYVCGVMAMNQGRKAISKMIEAFYEFARDKPEARLLLDMDKSGAAGWDIPKLLVQMGWTDEEAKRITFKEDLFKADMEAFGPLRNRYALLDMHMVISHREGFGLPLLESMACRLPTMALDWCSGTEICGDGRGVLVKRLDYMEHGSWGGARDAFPDMVDYVRKLNQIYNQRGWAAHIAEAGYQWAIQQTWDVAADQVEAVIQRAVKRARSERIQEPHEPTAPLTANLSDTRGPTTDTRPPVGDHPGLQPSGAGDIAVEVPGSDGGAVRAGGAAPDHRPRRRQPRRGPVESAGAASPDGAQPDQPGLRRKLQRRGQKGGGRDTAVSEPGHDSAAGVVLTPDGFIRQSNGGYIGTEIIVPPEGE